MMKTVWMMLQEVQVAHVGASEVVYGGSLEDRPVWTRCSGWWWSVTENVVGKGGNGVDSG